MNEAKDLSRLGISWVYKLNNAASHILVAMNDGLFETTNGIGDLADLLEGLAHEMRSDAERFTAAYLKNAGESKFIADSRDQVHAGKKLKDIPRADLVAFCNKIEREIMDMKTDKKVVSCFNISREYLRSTELNK